jgi:hypothetical protein
MSTAVALIDAGSGLEAPWMLLALATTAALAERASVRVATTWEYSISLLPTLFAAVLSWGPELLAPRNSERMPRLKWAAYTSTRFMCGVAMASLRAGDTGIRRVRVRRTDSSDTHRHCRR